MVRPRLALLLLMLSLPALSLAGEIVFVDPVREKAQSLQKQPEGRLRTEQMLEQTLEDARQYSDDKAGGVPVDAGASPAGMQSQNARGYVDDEPQAPPAVLMKGTAPPADAARMRQTARSWAAPAGHGDTRCTTENTVAGIEGTVQGHTVIQGKAKDANIQCK